MNWRWRAGLLRTLAAMPFGTSIYQLLQDCCGHHWNDAYLKEKFERHRFVASLVLENDGRIRGGRIAEVGTGWLPLLPLGWWICGADRVDTFDANRYLLPRVLRHALKWMKSHRDWLVELYGDVQDRSEARSRIDLLAAQANRPHDALRLARVNYHAPSDAAATGLPARALDVHFSTNVLEHVPPPVIRDIFVEARRALRQDGLGVHCVDPSDHFAHSDPRITRVNFLRFSEDKWDGYAGNRFAYHNRLREPQFRALLEASGFKLVEQRYKVDERSLAALRDGFPVAPPFRSIPLEDLCREELSYVIRPRAS